MTAYPVGNVQLEDRNATYQMPCNASTFLLQKVSTCLMVAQQFKANAETFLVQVKHSCRMF